MYVPPSPNQPKHWTEFDSRVEHRRPTIFTWWLGHGGGGRGSSVDPPVNDTATWSDTIIGSLFVTGVDTICLVDKQSCKYPYLKNRKFTKILCAKNYLFSCGQFGHPCVVFGVFDGAWSAHVLPQKEKENPVQNGFFFN